MINQACSYEQFVLPLQQIAHGDWLERARSEARRLSQFGDITIDDVREVCPPPFGVDGRVMGAVFKPSKDWECVGYRKSERVECNGRPVGVWRLK